MRSRRAAPTAGGGARALKPARRAACLGDIPNGEARAARPECAESNHRQETIMAITRRNWVRGMAAAGVVPMARGARAQAGTLKISHQFPGGSATEGDFRDRLCRRFAADIDKRSNGALRGAVYPGSSLMKTNAQFSAMRKGALDISLYPMPYAGGEVPETNIGLMPALVPSYEVGAQWKTAEVGRMLTKLLDEKGIVLLSWIWQAGGVASRAVPLVQPEDAKGLKVRGGSREMDLMLKAAGASVISLPSNEIYAAMQTGAMDAAMTSSTSFISFKLEEIAKNLTSGRNKAYWFMFEPLMMSKEIFAKLPKPQQDLVMAVGAEQEKFATDAAQTDDKAAAEVYAKAGAKVYDLDSATVAKWQAIARETAWKDYAERNESCKALMAAAQKLIA
jgi:TRAP-type transport system periplasmic protein